MLTTPKAFGLAPQQDGCATNRAIGSEADFFGFENSRAIRAPLANDGDNFR